MNSTVEILIKLRHCPLLSYLEQLYVQNRTDLFIDNSGVFILPHYLFQWATSVLMYSKQIRLPEKGVDAPAPLHDHSGRNVDASAKICVFSRGLDRFFCK